MNSVSRAARFGVACLLTALAPSAPAFSQAAFVTSYQTTDFSGEWTEEDMRDLTAYSVALFELREAHESGE